MNGKPAVELTPGLARRLRVRAGRELVEGVARSPDEAVASARRGMMILYGGAGALAALISAAALAGAAAYEPRDLVIAVPILLAGGAALWAFLRFMFRRNLGKARARGEAQAQTLAPGTPVRIDDVGVAVGGRPTAWADVAVAEIGVAVASTEDSTSYFVERLTLSLAGRSLILDMLALTNGRDVVRQTWRRLQPP